MRNKKQNGVYYTPSELTDFIINHLLDNYDFQKDIEILEPSCGDGAFVDSLIKYQKHKDNHQIHLSLIEVDGNELKKVKNKTRKRRLKNLHYSYVAKDYLKFQVEDESKFDLIVGNPPYVSYKYLSSEQINLCNDILKRAGINPPIIKNLWIAFLISAVQKLKVNGIVCFVLPSELLQVKHSIPIREFLFSQFSSIEIYTFSELVFEGIEQDTIIFIGSNQAKFHGIRYQNIDNLSNLNIRHINTTENSPSEKWTSLYLKDNTILYLERLIKNIKRVSDYCKSGAGIVTAADKSFILKRETVIDHNLLEYSKPIIKKSVYIKDLINFTDLDFDSINKNKIATDLLHLNKTDIENVNVHRYLEILKSKKVHEGYKCKKRTDWFVIPSVWSSDGFFFKRYSSYPKIIINSAHVYVTDTAYRINMNENYNINSLTFCFYNSLTFVFAELYGRFYGGGVLELTPNEFKNLPMPYFEIPDNNLSTLDQMFRSRADIRAILAFTNRIILVEGLGLSEDDIQFLNETHKQLMNRRLKTKSNPLPTPIFQADLMHS